MISLKEIKLDYYCHNCKDFKININWLHLEYCGGSNFMINEKGIITCCKCQKKCNILDCKWKCSYCGFEDCGNIHGLPKMFDTYKDKKEELLFILKIADQIKEQCLQRNEQSNKGTFKMSTKEEREIHLFNYGNDDILNYGIKFRTTCPVENCKAPKKDKIIHWKHKPSCGGDILLYKEGKFGCSNCSFSKLFKEYKLKCESCSSLPDSNFQISHALEAIAQYPSSQNLDIFADELMKCLDKQLNVDLTEIDFSSRCPVEECLNNEHEHHWNHECGARIFLNLKGEIICKSCNKKWLFKDYLFNCPNHKEKKPSLIATIKVLSALISQQTYKRNQVFFMEAFKEISKQFQIESLKDEIKAIKFETVCPIEQCYKKTTRYSWKHPVCNEELLLTNEGKLKCLKCNAVILFCDFPFKCEDHNHKPCGIEGAIDSIDSIVIPSQNKEASDNFIIKLTDAIIKQFERNPRVNEIDFISSCPNVNCIRHNTLFNWEHDCGGKFKLTCKGTVRCDKCNFSTMYVDFPEQFCICHCKNKDLTADGITKALCQMNLSLNHPIEKKFTLNVVDVLKDVVEQLDINQKNPNINITNNNDDSLIINNDTIYFVFPCPFPTCQTKNKIHQFLHPSCGGKVILRKKDWKLECEKCDCIIPIEDFQFSCGQNQKKKITSCSDIIKSEDVLFNYFQNSNMKTILSEFKKTLQKSIDARTKSKQENAIAMKMILYIAPCPVRTCLNSKSYMKFNHYNNKKKCGLFFITVDGYLNCNVCNVKLKYANFPFRCEAHVSQPPCLEGALRSIDCLESKDRDNTNKEFYKLLKENLRKQFA